VKVALIRDRAFFDFLHAKRRELARFGARTTEAMIVRCAELHLQHIRTSGDPFEMGTARPLDFGHWVAHKLEESSCGELRHGEAVAIGIAVDSLYSQSAGMIGESELHRILATLEELGFRLWHPRLADLEVRGALGEFREHLGGELCITLLDGIRTGVQVGQIDAAVMQKCIAALAARQPT
jgi:3-dehydroquinate synthase